MRVFNHRTQYRGAKGRSNYSHGQGLQTIADLNHGTGLQKREEHGTFLRPRPLELGEIGLGVDILNDLTSSQRCKWTSPSNLPSDDFEGHPTANIQICRGLVR